MVIEEAKTLEDKQTCYRLRHIVFVAEQGVPVELEIDEHDEDGAYHFLGRVEGAPAATARICVFGDKAKIQRVVVMKQFRGMKLGRALMMHLIGFARDNKLAPQIALDAQTYATSFYQSLGFVISGNEFDDAGIPHIHMIQPA
ncbi:MAG: GNAT family N-acetyltransferase [Rhizobiaceae bacterium]|nr:GNAT family N-acetyltransferase [Rhizobiaceae bacterium]